MVTRRVAGTVVAAMLGVCVLVSGCAAPEREVLFGYSNAAWFTAPAPAFVKAPSVRVEGGSIIVDFEVSRATDVAVLVSDSGGRVVRHIVAGLLGANPPAPLAPNSLAQSVAWDGRNDLGRCVPPGRYAVDVKLGLTVSLDKALGWNPHELGSVHGLAVAPNGELYVMSEVGRDNLDGKFQVFDSQGRYLRTIMPRPAGLPLERAKPLGELALDSGERFPLALLAQYGCRRFQVPVVTPEGDLIFTNASKPANHPEAKRFASVEADQKLPRRLLRIAADGGAPNAGYLGPVLGKEFEEAFLYLALGPDGLVHVSGARNAVFRTKWGENEKPDVFVGTPDKAGSGTDLKEPCGISFDAAGNLYVADRGNHRIAVFDRAGKLAAELPLEWPLQVVVHPRTGAVYATAGYKQFQLVKFDGMTAKTPTATCELRSDWPFIALDPQPRTPILYVANVDSSAAGADRRIKVLLRLTDHGPSFGSEKVLSASARPKQPLLYGVDRRHELVYGNWPYEAWWRMDGRTGDVRTFNTQMAPKANGITEITVAPDGAVAVHVTGEIGLLDRHLAPFAFSATGSYIVGGAREDCIRSYYGRDVCVAPNGDIYWIHERGGYAQPMRCMALNADGTLKKDSLIVFETGSPAGVRVDREGNVYVIDHLKPPDKLVPDAFRDKVGLRRGDPVVHHYGSLLKFRPTGGAVRIAAGTTPPALAAGQKLFTVAEGRTNFVADGVLWAYYGVSMIRPARPRDGCQCWTPRFDVDDFARVFVPDQLRCRVVVLDTNGNEILAFGRYGNPDDKDPGIALADPRSVAVSDEAAYVGDMTNQRVVRARLSYRTSATCNVRVAGRSLSELAAELAKAERIVERRQVLRLMNAEMRVEELRAEATKISPRLRRLDWDALVPKVMQRSTDALANADDARAVLAMTAARELAYWPQGEAHALLGKYLDEGGDGLRLAVVWGLWDAKTGEAGRELLGRALGDRSALVRVAAACVLAHQKDPAGLPVLLNGALSTDPVVFKTAETAVLRKVLPDLERWKLGVKEVEALVPVLRGTRLGAVRGSEDSSWYLHAAAIQLLASSGRPEAGAALLTELQEDERLTGNNLNRVIGGLGTLRYQPAVAELVKFLARGRDPEYRGGHSDRAEVMAATALAQVNDRKSVPAIAALLDSEKPGTGAEALRALSLMFDDKLPSDRRLVPKDGKLEAVRVDALPAPKDLRAAWEAYAKTAAP